MHALFERGGCLFVVMLVARITDCSCPFPYVTCHYEQVGVVLPATAWEHPGRWKASPHAVTVFNALKPLPPQASSSPAATAEQQGGEAREAAGQEEAGPVQQATQAAEVEMADPQKTPGNALGAASPGQAKDQGSLLRQQPQGDDVTKEILALEELHASPQASRTHYR